jgi:hypothetical protein
MRPLLDVAPVREVQADYVALLWEHFGHLYSEMVKNHLRPWDISEDFASDSRRAEAYAAVIPELVAVFENFWRPRQEIVDKYLRQSETMKSYFGGDISPVVDRGELSAVLLYTDTVILQCPILRLGPLLFHLSPTKATGFIIKHALNVMQFSELAQADVEPPILLFVGSPLALDEQYRATFLRSSEPYIIAHARTLLGTDFSSSDDVGRFTSSLLTVPDVMASLVSPSKLLLDTEWKGPIEEQIVRQVQMHGLQTGSGSTQAGQVLFQAIVGRMRQANEIARLSSAMGATPLITAPTSWQYLIWRYEYDAAEAVPDARPQDLVISNAILSRGHRKELPLIANISTKALVDLRSEGALDSMRVLLRDAVNRLNTVTVNDLGAVSRELTKQVEAAFDHHQQELERLQTSKKKFFGIDVAGSLITGALTLAGAATGNIPLATMGAVATALLGSKSVPAITDTWSEIQAKSGEMKRSPAAILLRSLKD